MPTFRLKSVTAEAVDPNRTIYNIVRNVDETCREADRKRFDGNATKVGSNIEAKRTGSKKNKHNNK